MFQQHLSVPLQKVLPSLQTEREAALLSVDKNVAFIAVGTSHSDMTLI
jgi:hypothetical protein